MENINDDQLNYNYSNIRDSFIYSNNKILNIGDKAPEFKANTTFGECNLNDYKRKMVSIL